MAQEKESMGLGCFFNAGSTSVWSFYVILDFLTGENSLHFFPMEDVALRLLRQEAPEPEERGSIEGSAPNNFTTFQV